MTKTCQQCGVEFEARKAWQKFCSTKCHDAYWTAKRYPQEVAVAGRPVD